MGGTLHERIVVEGQVASQGGAMKDKRKEEPADGNGKLKVDWWGAAGHNVT